VPLSLQLEAISISKCRGCSATSRDLPTMAKGYLGSSALIAGLNSIISCAAAHMRSKCASNFAAAPAVVLGATRLSSSR
jgi:hypothetical protein